MKLWSLRKILCFLQRMTTAVVSTGRYGIDDIRAALATAGRYLPATTCLINDLAGQYLLFRNRYTAKLHVGVKKETETLLVTLARASVDEQVVIGQYSYFMNFVNCSTISFKIWVECLNLNRENVICIVLKNRFFSETFLGVFFSQNHC